MDKEIIKFGDTEIKKQRFYQRKTHIQYMIEILIIVSRKISFGKKDLDILKIFYWLQR